MKRFFIFLSVLFLLLLMFAGGIALGLFWEKINPFHDQAAEDEQIQRWLTQLRHACATDDALKGTALRKFEQKTLFGVVAKQEQIPLVDARAKSLLAGFPKLALKYGSEYSSNGLKVFPLLDQVPRLRQNFVEGKDAGDDLERRRIQRGTRLDSIAIGDDGKLTVRGVCLHPKGVSDGVLAESIRKQLEAAGAPAESLPEVVFEMQHFDDPAPMLHQLLATEARRPGVHFLTGWYEQDGTLHLEGLLGKEEQRQPVEAAAAAWLNGSAAKAILHSPNQQKAAYKLNLVTFDTDALTRDLQRKIIAIGEKEKKPHWLRVRLTNIAPAKVLDKDKESLEAAPLHFLATARRIDVPGEPRADAELLAWLQTQLPRVIGADYKPLAVKLDMTAQPTPVAILQQKVVERGLDGTVFTDARYDAVGKLELLGRLGSDDAKTKADLTDAIAEPLATFAPWSLETLQPHQMRADKSAIAWSAVLHACQARLARDPGKGQRTRLDRLFFRYEGRTLRLDGAGIFLADAAKETGPDLNVVLDDIITTRGPATLLPGLLKPIPNPIADWQRKIADERALDGALLAQIRFGADGNLNIDSWLGSFQQEASLRKMLDTNISLVPAFVRPEVKEDRWTLSKLGQHPSLAAEPPSWTQLLALLQTAASEEPLLRRTRLDRARFVYRGEPRQLILHWQSTRMIDKKEPVSDPAKKIDDLARRHFPKLKLDLVEPAFEISDVPIYDLQADVVAKKLDGVLFTDASFNKDGKLLLDGIRGSDAQLKTVISAIEPILKEKYPAAIAHGQVPLDSLRLVPWQPMLEEIRGSYASAASPLLRQTRIDRVHFEYDETRKARLWLKGVCIYQGKNPPTDEQAALWTAALKARLKPRGLGDYDLALDTIERKDNLAIELQRKVIEDEMDGVVFQVLGFDAKGALRIHALTPKGQEENVRKLLEDAAKKHPHLVPIERAAGLIPTRHLPIRTASLGRASNEVASFLQPPGFDWQQMLVDLRARFAQSNESMLQQTRIDRAYFSLNEADPDQLPFLNIKGIALRTVHDDEKDVANLLRKELAKIVIPGQKYVLKIGEIKIVETPIYAMQREAVARRQNDPLLNILFERASYAADGSLVLHVLSLQKKVSAEAIAEFHEDKRLLPGELWTLPNGMYKTPTVIRRDFDWPAALVVLREQFSRDTDPLLQRTRLDDVYFAYAADRKKLHLHARGVCVHPTALVADAERDLRWKKPIATLIPKVTYEATTHGIAMLTNPSILWQDDAAALAAHDGILFHLACFDPQGKLKLAIRLPGAPQQTAATRIIAEKPIPASLEPIDPKNLEFQIWNWKQVLPTGQARLAEGDFVLRRARLDRVYFQYEPKLGDPVLHFEGVSLHPVEVEPAAGQWRKLERALRDLPPTAVDHKHSAERMRFLVSPIYALQTEAVARNLDGLLFADARYDSEGKLHIRIVAATQKQRTEAAEIVRATRLAAGVQRDGGAQPILDVSDIAWADILVQMQGWLARNNDTLMRKSRLDRGFFSYPPSKVGPDLNLAIVGIYPKHDVLRARLKKRFEDYVQLYVTDQLQAGPVAAVPMIEHVEVNPAEVVQAKVSQVRELDGVRLDDASFDADGRLIAHGIWVGRRQEASLEKLTRDTLTPGHRALARGLNWSLMQNYDSPALLHTLRVFVADQTDVDEVWLERILFDGTGKIRVVGFASRVPDKDKMDRKLPELIPPFESKKLPAIEGLAAPKKAVWSDPALPLLVALTLQGPLEKNDAPIQLDMLKNIAEHLRESIPKVTACDGLRIDRCYYDPQGILRIEGLADRPGHIAALKPFLDGAEVPFDQKRQLPHDWSGGRITVIALRPMMTALRESLPAVFEFDGFTIQRAHHDSKNRLVITGSAIGTVDEKEMTPILKRLLETHPRWRLRTTAGLVINVADRKVASADQSKRLVLRARALLQVTIGEAKVESVTPGLKSAWSHGWPFDDRLKRVRPTDEEYDRCLEYLDAALLHDPGNNTAWYLRAYCLQTKGRDDLALRDLRRMAELEAEDRDIRHQRILALELVQGKLRQSAFRLEQQATLDVSNGWTLRELRESPAARDDAP